jgi:exonuclease III
LRIVVWNCHQAFDKKLAYLRRLSPDIAVVPESANPETPKLKIELKNKNVKSQAWTGTNKQKGLGLYTFNQYEIEENSIETEGGAYTIRAEVKGSIAMSLIAMWTQGPGYVEEAHRTIEAYKTLMEKENVIFAGDFNSNKIWDKSHKPNHSNLISRLEDEFELTSIYHDFFKELQGAETRATIYFTYNVQRPYHIDYIFIPKKWLPLVRSVEVRPFAECRGLSDHCPLILDIDL